MHSYCEPSTAEKHCGCTIHLHNVFCKHSPCLFLSLTHVTTSSSNYGHALYSTNEFPVHHTLRLIGIILWCHMYNSVVLCWCFDVVSIISYTISCGERVWLSILRVYKWHLECWSHPPPRSSKNLWRITSQLSLQSLTGFVFSRSWLPRVRTSLNRSLLCCGMET